MSSTINASSAGIVETADASGTLQLQTGGQSALYIDASQNITIPKNLTVQGTLTFSGGGSGAVTTVSGGSTGLTPSTPASGNVVLGGTLLYSSGGTGLTSTGSSGNVLVSTGSGWTSSSLTTAGIAALASPTFTGTVNASNISATGIQASYLGLGGTTGSNNYPLEVVAVGPNPGATFFAGTTTYGVSLVCVADLSHTTGLCIFQSGTPASPTAAGSIYLSSSSSVVYATSSDRRLKTNISTLTGSGAFIDSLSPRTFTWIDSGIKISGFIADELQKVSPLSVTGNPNETKPDGTPVYQNVDAATPEIMANIIAELQLLRQRVATLEAKAGITTPVNN